MRVEAPHGNVKRARWFAIVTHFNYNYSVHDTLTVTLEHSVIEALRKESASTGRSEGEIVTEALQARLSGPRNETGLERFFGIIEGPEDLSTNKKHRAGWGKAIV